MLAKQSIMYWQQLTSTDCNQTLFCCCCCHFWLHSLYSWCLWWFSQLFQWGVSFEMDIMHTIWSGWARKTKQTTTELYASLHHIDAVWSRAKVEGKIVHHSCFIQTEMKRSGSYLVVNTHTLGPAHLRRGWGGSLLACNRYSFWCDSLYGFACWSTPEMILFSRSFHLLLDPVYRASPASHTKRSVSASTWHWWLYFSPVLGKHLPVIKKQHLLQY